jgi:hypothetical protein
VNEIVFLNFSSSHSFETLKPSLSKEDIDMNSERESQVVPAIVAAAGVIAFAILVYLLLTGADWLISRLLGSGVGTPF